MAILVVTQAEWKSVVQGGGFRRSDVGGVSAVGVWPGVVRVSSDHDYSVLTERILPLLENCANSEATPKVITAITFHITINIITDIMGKYVFHLQCPTSH